MALRLYLVRHGQTMSSRENRFSGETDVPLSPVGEEMAEALGAYYAGQPIDAVYTSPLSRAVSTAMPLCAQKKLNPIIEPGLREITYGDWEGRLEHEVQTNDAAAFLAWQADPASHAPPGGETGAQILARALPVLSAIKTAHSSGTVMIVSHKATLRILCCHLLGIPLSQFRARIAFAVCSTSLFLLHEPPQLIHHGSTSHLPPHLQNVEGT